ncbi:MAG TPA: ferrochelatase [Thermodesulfovibrionales bacterium]|nr:ferrochelatase [Thermodesulfovibrionales bacterium]
MEQDRRDRIGVLLVNLGGPDSLAAVRPFLFNLFSDREIIRLGPPFLQKPLAWLISSLRSGKTRDAYALIGGKSPINDITKAQAAALEKELNRSVADARGTLFTVAVGMRYWSPFFEEAVRNIHNQGTRRLLVLSLYPHYSVATTGSSLSHLRKLLSAYPDIAIHAIESWYDDAGYIDALSVQILQGVQTFGTGEGAMPAARDKDIHLLFSAHSLPVTFIEEGDPYVDHIMGTIRALAEKIDIPWSLSYQSKSGPVAWLEPSTERMLGDLARKGVKNLLVVPISFVSDHIETLYEIDILYKNMAADLGIHLERTKSLNTAPEFITALRDMVLKGIKEAAWAE